MSDTEVAILCVILAAIIVLTTGCAEQPERDCVAGHWEQHSRTAFMRGLGTVVMPEKIWVCTEYMPAVAPLSGAAVPIPAIVPRGTVATMGADA